MKLVGLISGGKDSIFNLLCCKSFGLEISALANLSPPDNMVEIDSYMYQSIGKELIPLISECMEVPLVRRNISGKAINQEINYTTTQGDEVEDLFMLLKNVKESFPDIQGVSCGAVMSNYQRNRLEEVCHRLKLQCYCFMWMIPEHALLNSIVEGGLRSMIVKVASFGLNESFLGRMVSECLGDFEYIQSKICSDFHCCGEGGEYESLTLDGPNHLFKNNYISISNFKSICLDSNPYAPVYVLKPTEYKLIRKEKCNDEEIKTVLPFFDPNYSLFYYLYDTGRYKLNYFGSIKRIEAEMKGDEIEIQNSNLNDSNESFEVKVFETEKTYMITIDLNFNSLNISSCSKKVSKFISENLSFKDWFISSKAVFFEALIRLFKTEDVLGIFELSQFWDMINLESFGVKWKPAVNISFTTSKMVNNSKFHIVIIKNSIDSEKCLIKESCSSSISSYGTSIPRSFSNSIIVSNKKPFNLLGDFQYKSGLIVDNPILLSSSVYGFIPHSGDTPNCDQIKSFLNMVNSNGFRDFHDQLCIELSLSLRSFRCNLNSSIYNSHLLSFKNEVDYRFDVFNITHIWIIELSIREVISLSEFVDYFKSLVNEYNYNKNYAPNKWSDIHKFIETSKYSSIDPIVIPIYVDYLPLNTKCKLVPVSLIMNDYKDYHVEISNSNSNFWNYELRSFSNSQTIAVLFELKETKIDSSGKWEEMVKNLRTSIDGILNKHNLSLNDKIICSKFFVVDEFYDIICQSQDPLIRASFISSVKILLNYSILQYLLIVSY
ncbi:P-loop ATPase [Cryptosporidium ubiquitum]|uniref:Diphthine--ammonia ligase n=1 Tax=Cryptosporidium ubiquitum TaxID=857276 RepID=A0A1J4MFS9_9CRYT|nr:P-loop ATPase [Cryptosporidium ubiquitum]OII71693.1 P-loop ATPase [Cryptosporidium ubiquitum]